MLKNLVISLLEYDITWESPSENYQIIASLIPYLKNSSVIILPEMFSTGFSMNAKEISETKFGESFQFLQKLAKKTNAAVSASIPIKEKGNYYNRLYFIEPNETFQTYDKRHLFSYATENEIYTPGKQRKILNYLGWHILPQVCYDLRFPVFSRNQNDYGVLYDVLYYVANWPESRISAWDHLLKARAIENLSYVIGVNRTGIDGNGIQYNGHSAIYNPLGEKLEATKPHPSVLQYEIDYSSLEKIRKKFPFLKDGDKFEIDL